MLFNTLLVIVLSVSGEYYCEAENGIGTDISPPKGPDVQYPPKNTSVSVSPSGEIVEGSSVILNCSSDASPPVQRYTWYKNRVELSWRGSSYTINSITLQEAGEYTCQAENGIGTIISPPERLDVQCLKVDINSDTVSGGETVELTCRATCTRLGNSFIWYKNEKLLPDDYRFSQSHRILTFTARSEDTGRYSCAVRGNQHLVSPAVTISVRCVKVEIKSSTVSKGVRVTLTCKITCTDLTGSQTFIWYKNGQSLQNNAQKNQNHKNLQFIASSGDAGSYSCAVRGHENLLSTAVTLYPPKSVSVSVSPSGEIVEGSSVTLTCSSDANPPVQRYTWFKNNGAELSWRGSNYTIKSITLQDAGEYTCQAENGIGTDISPPKRIDVKCDLSRTGWGVTYTPERICALKGSSVDMSCTYSYPTDYTVQKTFWFINDWHGVWDPQVLSKYSDRVEYLGNQNNDCTFRINQLKETDSKTYRFRFLTECNQYTGEPGVALEVTDLQVMVNPDTVTEGQSVRLTCSTTCTLTGSPAFIWYRDGSSLSFTDQSHQFTASSEDAGRYSCAVKGYGLQSPAVALNVRYPPKSVSVSASPSGEIVEGSSVTLTCSSDANPAVQIYTWYRKGGSIFLWRGSERSYTINKVNSSDAGEYYCEAENAIGTKRSLPKRLGVQYPPKSVSVSVSPSGEIVEGSSVTLTCSSDANPPVQSYTWYKKNDTGVWQAGSGQSLNFSNFRSWNIGQYYCEAQNRLGAQNASALLVTVQGGQSLIAAAAVGVAAILALVFLGVVCVRIIRRRKSTNETEGDRQGNKSPICGNVSEMAMSHTGRQDRDDGEVPLYLSVFPANIRNKEQVLYSIVQYASVQFPPPVLPPGHLHHP